MKRGDEADLGPTFQFNPSETLVMNAGEAAQYLGITRKTLYKWKRQSLANQGFLIFNSVKVRFRFRQTGVTGQGRIFFDRLWLDNLKVAMEGKTVENNHPLRRIPLSNIKVPLGLPPS